jgi:beta-glucosidase
MRGPAVERVLFAEKLFPSDIDNCVRKVSLNHVSFPLRRCTKSSCHFQILELLKHAYASGIPFNGPEEGVDTPELRRLLRTAAADATVLLKNDRNVLPLKGPIKKIAVIGPNAKQAMTSGGGSARLLSTYTVSPLEGISAAAKEIGAEVTYGIGATSHKFLPSLDPYISREDGQPGALLEFWNENPEESFLKVDADVSKPLKQCDWSTPTLGTNCFLMDGVVSLAFGDIFW